MNRAFYKTMETLTNFIILAQSAAAPATEQPQSGGMSMLMMLGLMFLAFYFLLIAPQRKKQKEHEKMISNLQSGDEIVSIGGICGTITNIKDKTFVVRVSDNTKIEFLKSAIQSKISGGNDAETSEQK